MILNWYICITLVTTFEISVLIDIIYITPIFDHLVSLLIPYQNIHPVDICSVSLCTNCKWCFEEIEYFTVNMTDLCPYVSIVVDHVLWVDGGPVPHGQWEPQAGLHHGDGFLGAGHPRDTTDVEHPQGGTCHWPTLWYRNVFVQEVILQSCSIRIFGKAYMYANKKIN